MATTIQTFRAFVDHLIGNVDEGQLSRDAKDDIIQAAVERYSHDRPDTQIDDESGDGGRFYAISGNFMSDWVEGFSRITEIEYPAATIANDDTPNYLEPDDFRDDYWASPAATESMRITYTVPWAWTSSPLQTTTPAQDFNAICYLAASLCCRAMAARFAQIGDTTIAADSTAHTTKSGEFARRAKEFEALYIQHMNLDDKGERAAGEFVDWDTEPAWPASRQFIFHGKEVR
jgi:hypothetical protein